MNTKNLFFTFASSKKLFSKQLSENRVLQFLWSKNRVDGTEDTLNATTTLPVPLKPRSQIYDDFKLKNQERAELLLKLKLFLVYAKILGGFYKEGAKNAWNNGLEQRRLIKSGFKIAGQTDDKGNLTYTTVANSNALISEMAQTIYMSKVENDIFNKSIDTGIIRNDVPRTHVDKELFNLSRSQFQLLKRTPKDFYKLPLFFVVLCIFFEMTPIVCWALPEIACETCILPIFLPRVWNDRARATLLNSKRACSPDAKDAISFQNAYSLPIEDVRLLSKTLRLIPRHIPARVYPESVLRNRMQGYYRYITVDNYYLCGMNGEGKGNIWNLSQQELLIACLERNLIENLREDLRKFDVIGNNPVNEIDSLDYFTILRIKLLMFIVNFENRNIGYLTIAPLVHPSIDYSTIYHWWKYNERRNLD